MLGSQNFDNYKQKVAAFFNSRINYDEEGNFHPHLANHLLELVPLHKGQKILDVATGTGLVAITAAQIVGSEGKVIGIDLSSRMLSQAQQKITATGLQNIELIEADADSLNFSDRSFDVIFCSSAIVWFADIPGVLHSWYRFLKPGGLVAFSCFSETSFMTPVVIRACARVYGISLPNINEPLGTPEKCHNLLQQAGFEHIEVKSEQFGYYLSLSDAENWWKGGWLHPKGNLLSQLNPEQLERLKSEYRAEIQALATDEGVWQDITTFFVIARK